MKIQAIQCPKCKYLVFSRARHDYRPCFCNEVAADGGFDYLRIAYKKVMPKTVEIEVDATKHQLYDDWNTQADKYGLIKPE